MAAYDYLAMDASGKKISGVLEADSERHARQLLRERQLLALKVSTGKARLSLGSRTGKTSNQRLTTAELAMLTRQMATLVQAALPLEEVLAAVAAQCDKQALQSMLLAVRARVLEGYSLAIALADYPKAFPELYRATVAAGERSGHLDQVLLNLADYSEASQAARQKIQLAMLYPCILLVAALAIVGFLLGFVVPDVIKVFIDSGQELPLLTRALVASSAFVQSYGALLVLFFAALLLTVKTLLSQAKYRQRWHALLLRLPLLKGLVRASSCTRFVSTLAILGRSGVPLLDALGIASEVVANQQIRTGLKDIVRAVSEGVSLTRALELNGSFPPMMLYMIASGERSGELDNMLERAAQQQEQQLANRIAVLMGLLEPAMLVFMGASVLVIVLAILMPILSLNQLIS
ncbi:type II secretion system inner membrane protein GspF [Pseudomonas sp. 5P_3.1_Bac2]|uniref:type II secretion system inner membrane protein GspF n=1 Tax=Pseudomonas sp. 5P_3.1_Bac2 TaxID=2971617 RepID=UPI0021C5695B|nr:type II secretion system inner membrane protein GspF [Pseudomonas sp. 5P_3.1_Bac2]MCU1717747.1 type II secretion system inner membrane protein GspF [Pseudomonas sp. 5P_3.1_Bac2]